MLENISDYSDPRPYPASCAMRRATPVYLNVWTGNEQVGYVT